ncbi:MAG TPA: hypothetical protein VGN76_01580 [Gemmatimonadales bacterium]|nr:hypothetical protein [Gemmatimonadales bacterium]
MVPSLSPVSSVSGILPRFLRGHVLSPAFSRIRRRGVLLLALGACVVGVLASVSPAPSEYVIEIGPIAMPANGGHGDVDQPSPLALALPVDGWLRGLTFELVDEKGERLPTGLLHHLNLIMPDHRELFSQIMLRIGAAGPETRPYSLPWFLGYRVRPGDSLLVTAMLHNPTPKEYRGVRLRVQLELSPATTWLRPLAIQPLYLDVMPPAGQHAFDLPPGRSVRSWEGRPAVAARLLAAGSHLHKYGTALRLEDISTGKVIWEAHPKIGDRGEVVGMPRRYFLPFGVLLSPDHRYRLTAEYNNPTGKVLEGGGMGALGGIVLPASGNAWPGVERGDSVYRRDVWVTTGEGSSHHGASHHGGHH